MWDVFDQSEKLGGAPFNFSVHASRLGHRVLFLSAVGDDARGRAARAIAAELGLSTDFLQVVPGAPTGTVSVRLDATGQPDFTIHRPAAYDALRLDDATLSQLSELAPEWLYFGTLHQTAASSRKQTVKLVEALPMARRFYDINLRRDSYTLELVADLLGKADVVKMNDGEAEELAGAFGADWTRKMKCQAVAVTRGANGAALRIGEDYAEVPGYRVAVADTVGAGDSFAAAFLHGLSQGWDAARTADFACRVGALVASRAGGVPEWMLEETEAL